MKTRIVFFRIAFSLAIGIVFHISISFPASASPLTPQARMRKLSLHIRGITPTREEYQVLQQSVSRSQIEPFLGQKTQEYLRSSQHVGKMVTRLDQLFRVAIMEDLPEKTLEIVHQSMPLPRYGAQSSISSMGLLFDRIVRENQSWDQLLTSKTYVIPDMESGFHASLFPQLLLISTRGAFGALSERRTSILPTPGPISSPTPLPVHTVQLADDDPRAAGAVTTARFLQRYSNTQINKNRRRAAAVFRIFLCDDMRPIVMAQTEEDQALLNQAFSGMPESSPSGGPSPSPSTSMTQASPVHATSQMEQRHGSDRMCLSCHEKLDPLANAFKTSGIVVSGTAAQGELFFRRENGSLVQTRMRGLGDLGPAITSLPEYARCQTKHFWNWFIGEEVPLTEARLIQLTTRFNQLGRKPNDFIAYLVNEPEFSQSQDSSPHSNSSSPTGTYGPSLGFAQVRPILMTCNSCHQGLGSPSAGTPPSFTQFPIGGTLESHQNWIRRMTEALDLPNNGVNRTMPPRNYPMPALQESITSLQSWIAAGAPDETGRRTLPPPNNPQPTPINSNQTHCCPVRLHKREA